MERRDLRASTARPDRGRTAQAAQGADADSAYVADVLAQIDGPVLLVGHPYGGAVNTNAAEGRAAGGRTDAVTTTARRREREDLLEGILPPGHPATAITPAALARQIGPVLVDLPLFLVAPLRRRRHRTWGATQEEVATTMPGDALFPRAQYRSTRAITISAPPEEVWPWLVQVGYRRGGWYADDLLDNFARPSARDIIPELQDLHVGQWLAWVPWPSERSAFVVDSFVAPEWLLWRSPNRTWAWRLVSLDGGRTRLISRLDTVYEWSRPLVLGTVLLMEVGDYAMMRRMLRGIRKRAENKHRRQSP